MPDDNAQNDLNKGSGAASGDGQPGKGAEGDGGQAAKPKMVEVPEEELNNLKSELEKTKSDRDNYRKATLDKKSQERSLDSKEGEGGKDQEGKQNQADVNKIVDEKLTGFEEKTRKNLQSRAQRKFLGKHQEFADDVKWNQVAVHLRLRGDEVTQEDYEDRIDEAHILHLRETGQLEQHIESERQKAKQQGAVEAQARTGMQAGDNGDGRSGGQSKDTLTPQGEELTRKFGNEPDKVRKVDVKKDRVITADKV